MGMGSRGINVCVKWSISFMCLSIYIFFFVPYTHNIKILFHYSIIDVFVSNVLKKNGLYRSVKPDAESLADMNHTGKLRGTAKKLYRQKLCYTGKLIPDPRLKFGLLMFYR
ncbi:hypothetical protein Hanom_Chr17g01537451 [Helianthus anomalus]